MKFIEYVKDPMVMFVLVLGGFLVGGLWLLYGRQPRKKIKAQTEMDQILDDDHDNCMY
ncbi:MAG: hypothetical protein AAB783_00365 [Patescibacteria group bacterium]